MQKELYRRHYKGKSMGVMRRVIPGFKPSANSLAAIDAICVRVGALDQFDRPARPEIARLLCVVALLRGHPTEHVAVMAVRINVGMLLGAMGPRLSSVWNVGRMQRLQPAREISKQINMSLGSWIADRLCEREAFYKDDKGVVHDMRLLNDAICAGLSDPNLDSILDSYESMIRQVRNDIDRFQSEIAHSVNVLRERWGKMVNGSEAA